MRATGGVRPHLDDKILASWNGLMLGAMARAYAVLATKISRGGGENLTFINRKLWDEKTRILHHRWRDGERDNVQLLESLCLPFVGVMDLYEATLEPEHLDFAIALAEAMITKFCDGKKRWILAERREARGLICA